MVPTARPTASSSHDTPGVPRAPALARAIRGDKRRAAGQGGNREGLTAADACIRRQTFEVVDGVPERNAAIAFAMLMAALERALGAAEHDRPWRHHAVAGRATVLEAACHDDCNRRMRMAFFVRVIVRAMRADDICHGPAAAAGHHPRRRAARCPMLLGGAPAPGPVRPQFLPRSALRSDLQCDMEVAMSTK